MISVSTRIISNLLLSPGSWLLAIETKSIRLDSDDSRCDLGNHANTSEQRFDVLPWLHGRHFQVRRNNKTDSYFILNKFIRKQIFHNHRQALDPQNADLDGRCIRLQVVLHYLRNVLARVFLRVGGHDTLRHRQARRTDRKTRQLWNSNHRRGYAVQDCYRRRLEQDHARLHDPTTVLHSRSKLLGNRLRELLRQFDLFLHILRHHHVHRFEPTCG